MPKHGQYFNGSGPASSETVTFYTDDDGQPGTILNRQTVVGGDTAGSFDIDLEPVALSAHTPYWVSVQANMDFVPGGEWGWEATTTQDGKPAAWQNPGDGFSTGCTSWGDLETCLGAVGPDLLFDLYGEAGEGSQTFAGYTGSLSGGAAKQSKTHVIVNPPLNPCIGKPNGILSVVTTSVMTSSDSWTQTTITTSCVDGLPVYTVRVCYIGWHFNSCKKLPIDIQPGDVLALDMEVKSGSVYASVRDVSSGQAAGRRVKMSGANSFQIGLEATKPNGKPYRLHDFGHLEFDEVTVNGASLETFDPTAVTLFDPHGRARATPSSIGEDGQSFDIEYAH